MFKASKNDGCFLCTAHSITLAQKKTSPFGGKICRESVGAAISRPQSCDPVRVYRGAKKMPFLLTSLSKGSLERVGDGVLDVPRGGRLITAPSQRELSAPPAAMTEGVLLPSSGLRETPDATSLREGGKSARANANTDIVPPGGASCLVVVTWFTDCARTWLTLIW